MSVKGITNLTNLYLYQRFINDVNDDPTNNISDTEVLRYVIDETCNLIGKKCGRSFELATYKEWVKGEGTEYLVLNNYPITSVKMVSTNGVDLFTVLNTGNPFATVTSNNTGVTITSIATDAVETSTEFLYATYTNVTDLVTAMDLISGWTVAVLSDRGNSLTQLIRPLASGWAVDEQVHICGPYLGNDIRVSYDSDSTLESIYGGRFIGDVFCWYSAGYTYPVCDDSGGTLSTAGNVPEGLTLIANQIIKDVMEQKNEDTNMKSEAIGDYKYTRVNIMSNIDMRWKDLSLYARISI